MLRIIKRQSIEELAQYLATEVSQPNDVFARIPIIVPSMAMGDWLNKYFAQSNGISALTDYHFFGMMQWAWVEEVTGEKAFQPQAPLSMTGMHWQLFAWLYVNGEDILAQPEHPLHELLSVLFAGQQYGKQQYAQGAITRLWTLSEQFARIYVRYMTLRPQWLNLWQQGQSVPIDEMLRRDNEMPDWLGMHYQQVHTTQRYLWLRLFADIYQAREQRVENFWQLLTQEISHVNLLPPQVVIFTLQGMTPDMLRFVERLARFVEVSIYHLTPTHHMIDDIVDAKWLQRYQIEHLDAQDAHFDAGHDLLSRFGKQARDQARLLNNIEQAQTPSTLIIDDADQRELSASQDLLSVLQQEIHDLDATTPSREYFKYLDEKQQFTQDESLQVHACHGLVRQLEVLRAKIITWLNDDKNRQLSDILIVLPEIGEEQALIRAVFPPDGRYDGLTLPARLTGVTAPETMNLWQSLSGFFTILERGFNAREVFDWLSLEHTINAFDLSFTEMQRAIELMQQAGFKRGFDEAHLQTSLAQEDQDYRFSFVYALDRLVVGLLMPQASMFHHTVPISHITMADMRAIDALASVAKIVTQVRTQQEQSNDVFQWLEIIEQVLHAQFSYAVHTQSYVVIQQSITDLRYQLYAQDALLNKAQRHPLPLDFVLNYIAKGLADRQVSSEPSGVITIGRLSAMRNLPYKLIAFLNVNIDTFPSTGMDDRYDLTTIDQRQAGDQIREEDDMSAFLDLILSARESCWFFYDRYKPDDAHEHLPSILLQELMDHLSANCAHPEQAQQRFVQAHPQNPFDPTNEQATIVPLWQSIHNVLVQDQRDPKHDSIGKSVPTLAEVFKQTDDALTEEVITLQTLVYELTHPAKAYAHHTFGFDFLSEVTPIDTHEPLHSDNLTYYKVTELLIDNLLKGAPLDVATIKRLPDIPAGAFGQLWFETVYREFNTRLDTLLSEAGVEALTRTYPQQVNTQHIIVSGALPTPSMHGPWVMMSAGAYKDKHLLRAWLHHLLWSIKRQTVQAQSFAALAGSSATHSLDGSSIVQFKNERIVFEALSVTKAQQYLNDWLAVWQYSKTNLWLAPIELMDKAYKEMLEQDSDKQHAKITKLCQQWWSNDHFNTFHKIDGEDIWAHITQHYGQDEQVLLDLIAAFVTTFTPRLIAPMYEHQTKQRGANDA